jgi:hypothetical protein
MKPFLYIAMKRFHFRFSSVFVKLVVTVGILGIVSTQNAGIFSPISKG